MKLWRDNQAEQAWELSGEDLAHRFLVSRFNDMEEYPGPVWQRLLEFICASAAGGGLQSAFTADANTPEGREGSAAFMAAVELAMRGRRHHLDQLEELVRPPLLSDAQRHAWSVLRDKGELRQGQGVSAATIAVLERLALVTVDRSGSTWVARPAVKRP